MSLNKPQKPTHRVSLVLDKGRDHKAIWQDIGALWRSKNNTLSGRIELAGDFTIRAGEPVSIVVSEIKAQEAAGNPGDFPYGENA